MPRINRQLYARTETYMEAIAEANKLGEDNDCFARAIWLTTGKCVPYQHVIELLALEGRRPRRGTFNMQALPVLGKLGFKVGEEVWRQQLRERFISRYPRPHGAVLKSVTTHHFDRFNDVWADGNNYIVFTKGHAAAVIDGVLHDHNRGRACRVRSIWHIVKA